MGHIHDKIDFTAEVYIVKDDKVLIRLHDKYKIWCSVGGHIELHETPNDAAVREAKEEVGLDVVLWEGHKRSAIEVEAHKELIPPTFMNIHDIPGMDHQHIGMVYFASTKNDEINPTGNDISNEWRWMSLEEIESASDMRPQTKTYAKSAILAFRGEL